MGQGWAGDGRGTSEGGRGKDGGGCDPGSWSDLGDGFVPLVGSGSMGTLLTKRRAVDLCRVATCLCRPVI
ncbi:Ms5788A family Cys-rich leader peptide [Plantactinospora solaniradicis]